MGQFPDFSDQFVALRDTLGDNNFIFFMYGGTSVLVSVSVA